MAMNCGNFSGAGQVELPRNSGVTNFSLSDLLGFSHYEFRRNGIIASKQFIADLDVEDYSQW